MPIPDKNVTPAHGVCFVHPEPGRQGTPIIPVFLPFLGCRKRCLYCDQSSQTGISGLSLEDAFSRLASVLAAAQIRKSPPLDVGFYGGTFTGLPADWAEGFIALTAAYKSRGCVRSIRCSTRPDALDPGRLSDLKSLGLDMVEVGVQSFDNGVLELSGRGYDLHQVMKGCQAVREAGLELGLQLLPGLPGHGPDQWSADIRRTLDLLPSCVRIYPCLVIEDTGLAAMWRQGRYRPWSLAQTLEDLAWAVGRLWASDIPVIRIGLPPEPGLLSRVLDGPWHPALGALVRGRVLFDCLAGHSRTLGPAAKVLSFPRRYSGEIWGHRGSLKPDYLALGISSARTTAWDRPDFWLRDLRTETSPS